MARSAMTRSRWIPGKLVPVPNAAAAQSAPIPEPDPVVSSADAKKFGLENFGNTCYANSVLQALYFCTPFRELVLQMPEDVSPPPDPIAASPPPLAPTEPLAPVRRKPERKHSTSGPPLTAPPPPPAAPPIPSSPPTLFSALRSLYQHISTNPGEKGTVAPRAFIDKLKDLNESFRSTMHQDAHEFLNYMLNQIIEEIEEERKQAQNHIATNGNDATNGNGNVEDLSSSIGTLPTAPPTILTTSSNSGTSPQDATLVHKLFEGVLTSETRCLSCETVSSRDESFLDLSIDIEQNSSVTACLRQFSASEMLCRGNKFSCDSCGGLQEAEKRMKIKKLPNVLALHLKRFKYQEDVQKYIKLTYRVAFPFELRLFNTVDDMDNADRLYNLFAIVVHIGAGPHHGHYVSIIKTLGTWLVFDDDNVYPIPENDIPKYFGDSNSGSAYVLYYQAVDIDLASLGLRTEPPPLPTAVIPEVKSVAESIPDQMIPAHPPGLVRSDEDSEMSEPLLPRTPSSTSSPRFPVAKTPPSLPLLQMPSPAPTTPNHHDTPGNTATPMAAPPPPTPTGKSSKKLFGIRRTGSISVKNNVPSAPVLNMSSSNPDPRTLVVDKAGPAVPTSASSPSLPVNEALEPPPPMPVPVINTPTKVHGWTVNGVVNGKEKEKDEKKEGGKEKEEKKRNWFTKRKSFRLGDKEKDKEKKVEKEKHQYPHADELEVPSSPVVPLRHTGESPHNHNGLRHSTYHPKEKDKLSYRQPSEADTPSDAVVNGAPSSGSTVQRPKSSAPSLGGYHQYQAHLNGADDSSSPGSASSSLASTSLNSSSLPPAMQSSMVASSSNSASPSQVLEFPPPRMSSLGSSSEDKRQRPTTERSHSKTRDPLPPVMGPRPASSSAAFYKNGHFERQLPPLPPIPPTPSTPRHAHERGLSSSQLHNGQMYVAEPDEMYGKGKTRSVEGGDHGSAYPDAHSPRIPRAGTMPASAFAGTMTPVSLASSVGGNYSTTTTSSSGTTASGVKRATRKLSLTAPMLGFGKRDKDKDREKERLKEREREREKERAPSAFTRF